MKIINPATEEVIRDVDADVKDTLTIKFAKLKDAQPYWANVSMGERKKIISRFSELILEDQEKLALTLTREMGKPLQQARNELSGAHARIGWLVENIEKYLSPEVMFADDTWEESIRYEPLGVVCNISAWNYPYLVGVNVFVPALLAGNTVMYKPSEYTVLTGFEIERLLKKSGIPDDVFQIAAGAKETGEHLLDLPFDGYFFTGSFNTGKYIFQRVSSRMVPCQCELGGKDPLYVADDISDILSVAAGTADGAFYNNGQSCCAVERIYVHENVYDRYVDAFVKEVGQYVIGNPEEPGTYIGPLSRRDQLGILEEQVADAIAKGAKVLTGGRRLAGRGYYFQPTVLVNVSHDMRVMQEESFGPIIGIMKVRDDAEAVEKMNDTQYGLTASVYCADRTRAQKILSQLDTGTGYWNCCDRVSAALPWSGRKHSGIGTTLSHAGIRAFVHPKAYHLKQI